MGIPGVGRCTDQAMPYLFKTGLWRKDSYTDSGITLTSGPVSPLKVKGNCPEMYVFLPH